MGASNVPSILAGWHDRSSGGNHASRQCAKPSSVLRYDPAGIASRLHRTRHVRKPPRFRLRSRCPDSMIRVGRHSGPSCAGWRPQAPRMRWGLNLVSALQGVADMRAITTPAAARPAVSRRPPEDSCGFRSRPTPCLTQAGASSWLPSWPSTSLPHRVRRMFHRSSSFSNLVQRRPPPRGTTEAPPGSGAGDRGPVDPARPGGAPLGSPEPHRRAGSRLTYDRGADKVADRALYCRGPLGLRPALQCGSAGDTTQTKEM